MIPVFDRTRVVREAILSCLNQTINDLEVIVVLDGSPVETRNVVNSFRQDPRVRVFEHAEPSGTACGPRNTGILEARGTYISLLDSDDLSSPKRLEHVEAILSAHPDADVVYGAVRFITDPSRHIAGIEFGDTGQPDPNGFSLSDLEQANQIYTLTATIRRSSLIQHGGFRISLRYCEDYELWLRLLRAGCKFRATERLLSFYRIHGGNHELNFKPSETDFKAMAIRLSRDVFAEWR